MTCESCGDKPKKCNKEFTKAVIEIDNPEQITLMRRVVIPASMGDDTTVPPVVGKYHNVLLYYEANSKSYLYSSDGIPTQLVNGVTDYEAAVNLPQINGNTLIGNKTGEELGLQDKLTAGDNITIEDNVISATDTTYDPATDTEIGLVKPGNGLEVDANGTISISDIEQYSHFFDTVADMKAATNLVAGDYARTLGFHSVNDGGGAIYKITDTGTANEMDVIAVGDLFAEIILPELVSPEMFGAYGDGSHDDTNAWNKSVSVGRDVKAFEKTYLVSTIEVTDSINIDCGNANFITSSTQLFNIHGDVVASLTGESDYTADDTDYTITNTSYASYTGFAFLKGDNNFDVSRDYYRGGFAATFDNGQITCSYPIPVTNTTIDIISPIRGSLKNVGNITHQTVVNSNRSILVKYGEGYVIENVSGKNLQGYVDIDIEKSINVTCFNLNITHDVAFNDNVSYIVYIEDSSFCSVKDSYLYNKKWHSWTSSGIYLCYKNSVADSTTLSDLQYSICDHPNALGTTVENVTATCIGVTGLSYINNIKLYSEKDGQRRTHIALFPPSIEKNAKFTVSNVYINVDAEANGTYCGIWFNHAPIITGQTYYFNDIYINNIKTNKGKQCRTYFNLPSTSTYIMGNLVVKDSWLDINLPTSSQSYITVTDFDITIDGITEYVINRRCDIGRSDARANKLTITNSFIRKIIGAYTTVVLNNTQFTDESSDLVVTNLYGSNLLSKIPHDVINAATIVSISNMQYNPATQQFNFVKANGTVYYQEVNTTTGLFETKTLA